MKLFVKRTLVYLTIFLLIASLFNSYQNSNTKSEKLDKIYVINLDRSVNRYKTISSKLDALHLPIGYTRFSAIDGQKIKFVNIDTKETIIASESFINRKNLKGKFDIICSNQYSGGFNTVRIDLKKFNPRTLGEIGIACSHKNIWQEIVNNGYRNTLILEDDMNFIDGFKYRLDQLMNTLPNDYEYLYLFSMHAGGEAPKYSSNPKISKLINSLIKFKDKISYKLAKRIRGQRVMASGYIISQQGAKKLLDNFNKYETVDHYVRKFIQSGRLISYETKPQLLNGCITNNDINCDTTIGIFTSEPNLDISSD